MAELLILLFFVSLIALLKRPYGLVEWIDCAAVSLRVCAYAPVPDEAKFVLMVMSDVLVVIRLLITLNEAKSLVWWLDCAAVGLRFTVLVVPLGSVLQLALLVLSYFCSALRIAIKARRHVCNSCTHGEGWVRKRGRALPFLRCTCPDCSGRGPGK